MADIVERLRGLADLFEAGDAPHHLVLHMRAGADEIERKKAEIASLLNLLADERTESMRLRAALEPFAKAADGFDMQRISNPEEWFAYGGIRGNNGTVGAITVGDLRRARAALEGK